MARNLFLSDVLVRPAAATVQLSNGDQVAPLQLAAAQPFTLWTDRTGGDKVTDCTAPDGLTPLPLAEGFFAADGTGQPPPLRGPNNAVVLWVDGGAGPRYPIFALEPLLYLLTSGLSSADTVQQAAADAASAKTAAQAAATAAANASSGGVPNGAITSEKLGSGAVTNEKLDTAAVTAAKLGSGSVTTGKLDAKSVTAEKLADGSVTATAIADGAVGNAELATGAVKAVNIASGVLGLQIRAVRTAAQGVPATAAEFDAAGIGIGDLFLVDGA